MRETILSVSYVCIMYSKSRDFPQVTPVSSALVDVQIQQEQYNNSHGADMSVEKGVSLSPSLRMNPLSAAILPKSWG